MSVQTTKIEGSLDYVDCLVHIIRSERPSGWKVRILGLSFNQTPEAAAAYPMLCQLILDLADDGVHFLFFLMYHAADHRWVTGHDGWDKETGTLNSNCTTSSENVNLDHTTLSIKWLNEKLQCGSWLFTSSGCFEVKYVRNFKAKCFLVSTSQGIERTKVNYNSLIQYFIFMLWYIPCKYSLLIY